MLNFKRILFAVVISCSIGTLTTVSTIATAGEAMRSNTEVIKDVLKSLNESVAALDNNESKQIVLKYIQNARQFSKEINVGSLGAIVDRGADAILSSSRSLRKDDKDAARESLNSAIEEYTEMGRKTL